MRFLLVVTAIALLISACGGSSQEAEPTFVPVPTFTSTPATIQPTIAPAPAETPVSTAAASSPTGDYQDAINAAFRNVVDGIGEAAELSKAANLQDATWIASVTAAAAKSDLGYKTLLAIMPPAELADFHAQLLDTAKTCNLSVGSFALGIEQNNEVLIKAGVGSVSQCTDKIKAITEAAKLVFQ